MSVSAVSFNSIEPINSKKLQKEEKICVMSQPDVFVKSNDNTKSEYKFNFEDLIWEPLYNAEDCKLIYEKLVNNAISDEHEIVNNEINLKDLGDLTSLLNYLGKLDIPTKTPDIPIIMSNKKPLVSLIFVNSGVWFDKKVPMLAFHNPKCNFEKIAFGVDKNGELFIDRPFDSASFWDNGNLKKIYQLNDYEYAYATYYNKDGTKSFWKNLFFKYFN